MHEVNASAVNSLHSNIIAAVQRITGMRFQILPGHSCTEWQTASIAKVSFELAPNEGTDTTSDFEYIDRNRGGRAFVFRLSAQEYDEEGIWAGWYEEWCKNGTDSFSLIGLSWTFYWGAPLRAKPNILRAEWDSIRPNVRNAIAAQPHWHVDSQYTFPKYRRTHRPQLIAQAVDDLIEIPSSSPDDLQPIEVPAALQDASLSAMHLGMGGWVHPGDHPHCWRRDIPAGWQDVTDWVEKSLRYAMEQFSEGFKLGESIDL